jgi:hypothetical protein
MTLEAALNLLATMPGKPAWNDDIASLYSLHLADWHPETRQKAVLDATATCSFRPAMCELREIALRHIAPLPSAAALREQLRQVILFHPPAERAKHASPLLRDLADELGGWREIGMLDTEEMDRRFPGAVARARDEYLTRNAPQLLASEPVKLLRNATPPPLELAA